MENTLSKYNVFLRPLGIDSMIHPVIDYLNDRKISYSIPSLGHHVTILGFYSVADEDSLCFLAEKNSYNNKIVFDSIDVFSNNLVLKLYKQNGLIEKQKNIMDAFKPFIIFKNGSRPADNPSLFLEKYAYAVNYVPHLTISKGNFSQINGIAKELEKVISNIHPREHEVEYCLSKKSSDGWKCLLKKWVE